MDFGIKSEYIVLKQYLRSYYFAKMLVLLENCMPNN